MAPVSWLNKRYNENMALIWFDAHGDLNTPEGSPSGHFHGMPLRMLLGEGDTNLKQHSFSSLNTSQVFLVCARDLDDPELDYIQATGLQRFSPAVAPQSLLQSIRAAGFDNVYIHFDLDVLDPGQFTNMIFQIDSGLGKQAALSLVKALVHEFQVVGSSLLEYVGDVDPQHEPFLKSLRHWLRDVQV